jgi:hypothetical protein
VNNVLTALALRKFSINSIAATFAVLLAVTAGGAGGYWLKSQVPSAVINAAQPPVAAQSRQVAPPHDMPDYILNPTDAMDRAIARSGNATRSEQNPNWSLHDRDQ